MEATTHTPKPGDREPLQVQKFTGCVCRKPHVRCEPSPGIVSVCCSHCGATQWIEFYATATPSYQGHHRY
jgi:hypothetical protein